MKAKTKKIIYRIIVAFVAIVTIFFMVSPFTGF